MTTLDQALWDRLSGDEQVRARDECEVVNYGGQDCFATWSGPTRLGVVRVAFRAAWAGDGYAVEDEPEFVEVIA